MLATAGGGVTPGQRRDALYSFARQVALSPKALVIAGQKTTYAQLKLPRALDRKIPFWLASTYRTQAASGLINRAFGK